MEFPSRKHCIDHYADLYPNLARYMIEIALDYDLNRVKPTGSQKRARKRHTDTRKEEADDYDPNTAVKVIAACEKEESTMIEGCIEVDGIEMTENLNIAQSMSGNKSTHISSNDRSIEEC
jgi:hypothetical protein